MDITKGTCVGGGGGGGTARGAKAQRLCATKLEPLTFALSFERNYNFVAPHFAHFRPTLMPLTWNSDLI